MRQPGQLRQLRPAVHDDVVSMPRRELRECVRRPVPRTMVEELRRRYGLELEVDLDAVALVGADAPPCLVEGEALLVVTGDDLLQLIPR